MQVILDGQKERLAFQQPRALIRADRPEEVPAALGRLEAARTAGHWLAGAFFYELGYALEPRLTPRMPDAAGPLLLFGVFDGPGDVPPVPPLRAWTGPLKPEWDASAYGTCFAAVKEKLAAGDIYQANLSFRARFAFMARRWRFMNNCAATPRRRIAPISIFLMPRRDVIARSSACRRNCFSRSRTAPSPAAP